MSENVTVTEVCSCGATFNWHGTGVVAAMQADIALKKWRADHRHDKPAVSPADTTERTT